MKNVCLFFFSGTGMTKYVVDRIVRELIARQLTVDVYPIETTLISSIPLDAYDSIGISYPVHAFNAPKIVINFAKALPETEAADVFLLSTAGEDHPVNYASSRLLIRILQRKSYRVFYDKLLAMPSNFIVKYDEPTVEQMLLAIDSAIPQIAQEIVSLTPRKQKSSFFTKVMAVLGRVEWFGAIFIGKMFDADKSCNHCGVCVKHCPNRNIAIGKRIRFHWRCGLCMRCLYLCPQHAIKIRWPFRFIRFDTWYQNENLQPGHRKQS